jgi:Transposase domain (DUF772)
MSSGVQCHLAVYLLQQHFNKTDRQIEYGVKDNAAYQIFCGLGIVKNWHVPDHTKIENFVLAKVRKRKQHWPTIWLGMLLNSALEILVILIQLYKRQI